MTVVEKIIETKDYLTKSNLPASDYVINPYIGCPHACKYCYARFMKRFTNHPEAWGSFIDIKHCDKNIRSKKLEGKSVFLSSVTDCYNPYEEKYEITRNILYQLKDIKCSVTISTKSNLILRDMDLLRQFKDLTIAVSINTLNESFRSDMDLASTVEERISALKILSEQGFYTVVFISPIFPLLTDVRSIVERTSKFTSEYWFENLNLRGDYKKSIFSYIEHNYPQFLSVYRKIYNLHDIEYWIQLSEEIEEYCEYNHINYTNYFYHDVLVAQKKQK